AQGEAAGEQVADGVEVEQPAHQLGVDRDRVDHLHRRAAQPHLAGRVQRHVRRLGNAVAGDLQRPRVNGGGQALRRRTAGGVVELDPEVAVGAARVVAGGKDDAAVGAAVADDGGG